MTERGENRTTMIADGSARTLDTTWQETRVDAVPRLPAIDRLSGRCSFLGRLSKRIHRVGSHPQYSRSCRERQDDGEHRDDGRLFDLDISAQSHDSQRKNPRYRDRVGVGVD